MKMNAISNIFSETKPTPLPSTMEVMLCCSSDYTFHTRNHPAQEVLFLVSIRLFATVDDEKP